MDGDTDVSIRHGMTSGHCSRGFFIIKLTKYWRWVEQWYLLASTLVVQHFGIEDNEYIFMKALIGLAETIKDVLIEASLALKRQRRLRECKAVTATLMNVGSTAANVAKHLSHRPLY